MKSKTTIIIVVLILFAITFAYQLYRHEDAHHQIFRQFGCNSTIEFDWMTFTAKTIPSEGCRGSEAMATMHAMNEIVSYNLEAIEIMIMIVLVTYIWICPTLNKETDN